MCLNDWANTERQTVLAVVQAVSQFNVQYLVLNWNR